MRCNSLLHPGRHHSSRRARRTHRHQMTPMWWGGEMETRWDKTNKEGSAGQRMAQHCRANAHAMCAQSLQRAVRVGGESTKPAQTAGNSAGSQLKMNSGHVARALRTGLPIRTLAGTTQNHAQGVLIQAVVIMPTHVEQQTQVGAGGVGRIAAAACLNTLSSTRPIHA
jgi:hypothetical protein